MLIPENSLATLDLLTLLKKFRKSRKQDISDDLKTNLENVVNILDGATKEQLREHSFQALFKGVLTHLTENEDEDIQILMDLLECYSKCKSGTEEEPLWADVLTDLVLSLLPSISLNVMKQLLFGYKFAAMSVTEDSIDVISSSLQRTNSNDESGESDDESNDDEDEESEDEENEDDDVTELEQFRAKISGILGHQGDEEDVADDEEMMKLDEALAVAFKERLGNRKKGHLKVEKMTDDFKCRVLSVYLVILKRRELPSSFILPLLPIMIKLSQLNSQTLSDKALSVIGQISSTPIAKIVSTETSDLVSPTLESIISQSFSISSNPRSEKVQQFMAQLIIWTGKLCKAKSWTISKYDEQIVDYFKTSVTKPVKFNGQFFTSLIERNASTATLMQDCLIEKLFDESIKIENRALVSQLLALSLKLGNPLTNAPTLLKRCHEQVELLLKEEKPRVLYLTGLLCILDTLKSCKKYNLEMPSSLPSLLSGIPKKMRNKMPKSGQNSLKSLMRSSEIRKSEGKKKSKDKMRVVKEKDVKKMKKDVGKVKEKVVKRVK